MFGQCFSGIAGRLKSFHISKNCDFEDIHIPCKYRNHPESTTKTETNNWPLTMEGLEERVKERLTTVEVPENVIVKIKKKLGVGKLISLEMNRICDQLYLVRVIHLEDDLITAVEYRVVLEMYRKDTNLAYKQVQNKSKNLVNYAKNIFIVKINNKQN